jgi:hypothetical protein
MTTKTVKQPKKRKLIDISEEALNILSIKAVSKGKSLKAYIESLVEREAKITDEEIYAFMLEHYPPEPASEEETKAFEALLNV